MPSITWTDEHIEAFKRGFDRGLSFSQIADELNARFGTKFTRNATIGKAHRLGLKRVDPKPVPRLKTARERVFVARARVARPQPENAPEAAPSEPLGLSLLDMEAGQCRWPFGTGPYTFCGCSQAPKSSYCAAHYRDSIVPGTENMARRAPGRAA